MIEQQPRYLVVVYESDIDPEKPGCLFFLFPHAWILQIHEQSKKFRVIHTGDAKITPWEKTVGDEEHNDFYARAFYSKDTALSYAQGLFKPGAVDAHSRRRIFTQVVSIYPKRRKRKKS